MTTSARAPQGPLTRGRATLLTGLTMAVIAFQLNATMLNPAVTQMEIELGVTTAAIAFSSALFFLSKAIFQVFMPRLSDMVGRRRVLLVLLAILAAGTVIAMVGPTVEWLYVGRFIQGTCGPVFTIALLTLREAIPDEKEYGTRLGVIIAINGGIAGIDVILGGWMAEHFGFRSILALCLVLTIAAILAVIAWVPSGIATPGARMDWWGVAFIAVVVVALSWAVGGDPFGHRFPSLWAFGYIALAALALLAFVARQRSARDPLIPADQLGNRAIWAMPLTTILTLAGVMAVANLVGPSFAQNPAAGWGMSATLASILFIAPYALVGWVVGPFAGRLAPRVGYVRLLQLGLLSSAVVIAALALVGLRSPIAFGVLLFVLGITYGGITNVMLNGLGVLLSPASAPGLLPGLNGASFAIGAGLSFTIVGQAITNGSPAGAESSLGYAHGLWICAGIALLALLITPLLPKPQLNGAGGQA
ncbi:MFS transporter [Brachybacterium hainanense]|uniref:MFS transporter n=1 Tax=Brachybacterium hainanense TaxID=1541174 RepID=A0ABV6R904_9MICO